MHPLLSQKNIIVTGGSRGIGAEIVRCLAENGARVAFSYSSNEEAAQKVLESLPGEGHLALAMNVSSEESISQFFEKALAEFGNQIHGLVNNAGITKDNLLLRMKPEDFQQVLQTNLTGSFLCIKSAIKPLMKNKGGSIVNITSVVGQSGNPGQANYTASKAGMEAMSKSIALEFASRNIRSNCVAPGFIETEMTGELTEAQKEAILSRVPLKKMGDTHDVAAAVAFLLSDQSKYITGQTIGVNGGLYM